MKVQVAELQSKGRGGRSGAAKPGAGKQPRSVTKLKVHSSDGHPPVRYTTTLEDERAWMDF